MWVKSSGALSENVFHLTTAVSTHALVVGDEAALVDTSITAAYPRLLEQLATCLGVGEQLDYILLTHADFDHIGGLICLREHSPEAIVVAAPLTAERLAKDEFIRESYEKNKQIAEALNQDFPYSIEAWSQALKPERIMGDGDSIDLGEDVEVKLISSPGHSSDSVSYFVRPDTALACGEAVGSYAGRDKVYPCFLDDYSDYLATLGRLSTLDVQILCLPHSGVIRGEMVQRYFLEAQRVAEQFMQSIKERIAQGELVDEIVATLLPEWQSENICPEGPFVEELENTLRKMVKASAAAHV